MSPDYRIAVSCGDNSNVTMLCFPFLWPNYDFHVPVEGVEKPEEPVGRKTLQPAAHQGRYLRLVYSQQGCRPGLVEFAFCNDIADAGSNLRLGNRFFGIEDPEVSEDIAT